MHMTPSGISWDVTVSPKPTVYTVANAQQRYDKKIIDRLLIFFFNIFTIIIHIFASMIVS
jgi:hypothetical protein